MLKIGFIFQLNPNPRTSATKSKEEGSHSIRPTCAYCLNIPKFTHNYIGVSILICFIVGQTIHYFYLEEKKGRALKRATEDDSKPAQEPEQVKEEKDRREKLAYGISTNSYIVEEGKTPAGRVTTVLEKRRALAPPITPAYGAASMNALYESRTKTVQKEEAMICQVQVTVDKWGRGAELISLINDTDISPSLVTAEEKAKYAMELVQQHVEKMTEQKVFLHGYLEDRTRLLSGSENLESEIFSEVRLELKLEMTAPVHLLLSVFSAKIEPKIEKTAPPARISELTSVPNKEAQNVPHTPRSFKKGKSAVSSLEEKQQGSSSRPVKVTIPSPDKIERRGSSKRKTGKKTSDLSDLAPLQQVQQGQLATEKQRTPKDSPMPSTPEKPSSGQMPLVQKKKKKESPFGQDGSNSLPS
ncbi:Protein CBR-ENU-3 [Caenorhabditis briggsae]|uniref:Protein CBR-ENU-3 n=1 Tax=Caenorhabditis briggsae TaxID=6238 RepID=A8XSE0_CAEBR|nr:Protein CBR-ENU-3 [Caenorhabditis briggsae]CAP35782.2 Protein CBR-ENU-3 [Caenorhabditis briggsae]